MTDLEVYKQTLSYIYKTDQVTEDDLKTLFQDNNITFSPKIIEAMKKYYNSSNLKLTDLSDKDLGLKISLDTVNNYVEDTVFDTRGNLDIDSIVNVLNTFQSVNKFTEEQINNFFSDKSDKESLESYLKSLLS